MLPFCRHPLRFVFIAPELDTVPVDDTGGAGHLAFLAPETAAQVRPDVDDLGIGLYGVVLTDVGTAKATGTSFDFDVQAGVHHVPYL